MPGSALKAVQAGMYTTLAADSTLVATLLGGTVGADTRIYDAPKENQAFPYLIVGDASEDRDDTMGATRKKVVAKVTAWSRAQGMLQLENILDRVAALLDGAALSITGYQLARCVHDSTNVGRLQDGVTRWAQILFTLTLRQV